MKQIVLFDGVCNLCNGAVQFIMKRDDETFHFASLQSDIGQKLLRQYRLPPSFNSIVLIRGTRAYVRSDAVLQIGRQLTEPYATCSTLAFFIPRSIRDVLYRFVARSRYQWFGKRDECRLPTPNERKRFL